VTDVPLVAGVRRPAPKLALDALLSPWRGTVMVRGIARAALDIPLGFAIGIVITWMAGVSLLAALTFVVAIPLVWLTFTVSSLFGKLERARAAALLDVRIPTPHPPFRVQPAGTWGARLRQCLTTPSRWREVGYLALGLPFLGGLGFVVLGTWAVSVLLVAVPVYAGHTAAHAVMVGPWHIHAGRAGAWWAFVVGIVGLSVVAPQLTMALVLVDRAVVQWLLGPHENEVLARRVGELEVSRGAALDQVEAERRRIERDLHDGAQQRLVALAMQLGRARERFATDPVRARELVEEAHEEAKAALAELRNLARGIHPAVLTERGLDAALTALVARCPVPVSLSVEIPTRLQAPVESAAYFVVSEALTNVAKHSRASNVTVVLSMQGQRLLIEVRDDGVGGARASGGTGLAGMSERVIALGGWMRILSPVGGPTSILVELPCVS
jgi:signal transduction histidine kinase